MAFNEEIVVRAAAASAIPLISAVGHETDTTLIDYASDRRAPTPTAAAEMAVPVRLELLAELESRSVRLQRALLRGIQEVRIHLAGLARGLPDPVSLIDSKRQALDDRAERLVNALRHGLRNQAVRLQAASDRMSGDALAQLVARMRQRFADFPPRLHDALARLIERQHGKVESAAARLQSFRTALDQVLERGYAMVRVDGALVTSAAQVLPGAALSIEFHDGSVAATADGSPKKPKAKTPARDQGKLFAFLLLLVLTGRAEAGTLTLSGEAEQGGLVRGHLDGAATVALDGKPVRIAPDGNFIIGFGRDAPAHAVLDVAFKDGDSVHRNLAVKPRQWDVRRINGLPEAQVTPDPQTLARINRESAEVRAALGTDSDALYFEKTPAWPVTGTITGIFGSQSILNGQPRAPHEGVDVTAPAGTPVKAALAGTVTLAEPDLYLDGGTIVIDHGYGLSTTYLHLSSFAVKLGDKVAAGQTIGALGATGRATGPNLHWGLSWYQVRLDPQAVAGKMPGT
jgi:murein DD-endopeptidase MepM/ murein hydrolase activator NlpD